MEKVLIHIKRVSHKYNTDLLYQVCRTYACVSCQLCWLESLSPTSIINNTTNAYEENGVFGFNCAILSPVFYFCALSFLVKGFVSQLPE